MRYKVTVTIESDSKDAIWRLQQLVTYELDDAVGKVDQTQAGSVSGKIDGTLGSYSYEYSYPRES